MAGFYLGLGLCCILLGRSRCSTWRSAVSWLITAFGRVVSMMSDRGNTLYNWVSLVVELVAGGAAAGLCLRLRCPDSGKPFRALRGDCDKSAGKAVPPTCCGLGKPVLDGNRLSAGDAASASLVPKKIQ